MRKCHQNFSTRDFVLYLYERSEKEIRNFEKEALRIAGGLAVLEEVIEKLRGYGYIDDSVFASWVIESRRSHNPMGQIELSVN